jgi:ribosomal protein L16/L10AE
MKCKFSGTVANVEPREQKYEISSKSASSKQAVQHMKCKFSGTVANVEPREQKYEISSKSASSKQAVQPQSSILVAERYQFPI